MMIPTRVAMVLPVLLTAFWAPRAAAAAAPAPAPVELLTADSLWRAHVTWRMPARGTARQGNEPPVNMSSGYPAWGRWIRSDFSFPTPLPPEGWQRADFDDSCWLRRRADMFGRYGYDGGGCGALVCLRGRFAVDAAAPLAGLKLHLAHLGGVVAYLNGREIARRHLPPGPITPLTLADDYAPEVFLVPGSDASLRRVQGRDRLSGELLRRYEQRVRIAEIDIPADAVRKGVNVLALELHRSALPPAVADMARWDGWSSAGVAEVKLTAPPGAPVRHDVPDPNAVQVWTAGPFVVPGAHADFGEALTPLRPIRLLAPRNGFASGQVVVSSPAGVEKLRASATALSGPAGAAIPAAAVRVRYGRADGRFVPLFDAPVAPPAREVPIDPRTRRPVEPPPRLPRIQPVWVTAKVPPEAKPGRYAATLHLTGLAKPVDVPVELTVFDWPLPQPRDWKTWVNLLQSPESVAGVYKVPLWSDRHFALLGRSLELMGLLGNDILGVNVVARTVFGDDPALVWRRCPQQECGWKPEFRYLRRYLETYARHAAAPKLLSLQVWHYGLYYSGSGRDGTNRDAERAGRKVAYPWRSRVVPIRELRPDGKLADANMPIYGEPGTEAVWKEVFAGLRDILKDLGWKDTRLLLGTSGDACPSPTTVKFFAKIAPDARWRVATHGGSVGHWGVSDIERTQPNGMVVGFANLVRRNIWRRVRAPQAPTCVIARDVIGDSPHDHFGIAPLAAVAAEYDGFCWQGVDYWAFGEGDQRRGVLAKYVGFGNIVPHRPMAISVPGPDGALPTPQFEMFREGLQACEAMHFLRGVLADKARAARLDGALASRARSAVQELLDTLESGRRLWPAGTGDVQKLVANLYAVTEEVAKAAGTAD